jgi:hypothetical protein
MASLFMNNSFKVVASVMSLCETSLVDMYVKCGSVEDA